MTGFWSRLLAAAVGTVAIGAAVLEVAIYAPPIERVEHTLGVVVDSATVAGSSTQLEIRTTHDTADSGIRLAAFRVSNRIRQPSEVFVYVDPRYPTANVPFSGPEGVYDHLKGELLIRNYVGSVTLVNADQLLGIVKATDAASGRALVVMSGVLPVGAFSKSVDFISPWVTAGGLLVWGGGAIGYYSGIADRPLSAKSNPGSLGEVGAVTLLGSGVVHFPSANQRVATSSTPLGTALDISYNFASAGVDWHAALAQGGQTFGFTVGPYSSVTYLPHGMGGYLIFGGEIIDPASVSSDLARLLLSGAIFANGPAATMQIDLAGTPQTSHFSWTIPFTAANSRLMFVAFDPSPDAVYYYGRILP